MKYIIAASLLLLISSCSQTNSAQTNSGASTAVELCNTADSHTLLTNESYNVYVYYPEPNVAEPGIWEGPICTQSKQSNKICNFDESLIGPTKFLGSDSLSINTFSGSESWDWVMNLETCEIEQK